MEIVNIQDAIKELQNERPIIIFDKYTENEGDLCYPSEIINKEIIKFMMNECKGIICQTLPEEHIRKLEIPIFQKKRNNQTGQTNFVYPVDHIDSETGISCNDRTMIIKGLVNPNFDKEKIVIPGHQSLLKISTNGILERQGHTEASSEIVTLAGYYRSATICELIDEEGVPRRLDGCLKFAKKYNIKIVYLESIHKYFLKENNIMILPQLTYLKNPFQYLNNKTAIVTGSSSGIGLSIKNLLKNHNCSVIDISRTFGYDVTDYEKINKYISSLGKVDFLINCAGYIEPSNILDTSLESWNKHININLTSIFNLTKQVIPIFKKNKGGKIINISSPSANKVRKGWSGYCCTKAALNSFTKISAEELIDHNIKVFAISPSKTDTPMIHKVFKGLKKDDLINPNDISKLVVNILSDNKLKTGTIYNISLTKKSYN
jgi:3,4-dihydroxy-2-butanone 4-phosphate synthase